ncbi:hypothetical protein BDR26DRAFT_916225 [Obelidium mucronatum]|nr:hypothetical protein BDR26DRAFT_916225 [Obelidium mucronatum]
MASDSDSDAASLFDLSAKQTKKTKPKQSGGAELKRKTSKFANVALPKKRSYFSDDEEDEQGKEELKGDKKNETTKRSKQSNDNEACIILSDDESDVAEVTERVKAKDNSIRLKLEAEREKLKKLQERKASALLSSPPHAPLNNKPNSDDEITEEPIILTVSIWERESPETPTKVKLKVVPSHPFKIAMEAICLKVGVASVGDMVFKFKNVELIPLSTPKSMISHQNGQSLRIDAYQRGYYNQLQIAKRVELERTVQRLEREQEQVEQVYEIRAPLPPPPPPPAAETPPENVTLITITLRDKTLNAEPFTVKPTTKISSLN